MGKRSSFARRPMDAYQTPPEPVQPLLPHLGGIRTFSEPCAGEGRLIAHLEAAGLRCVHANDFIYGEDARKLEDFGGADAIITNPPWSRDLLHDMIVHFQRHAQTWLLFDSDWAYTVQARPFLPQCSDIVAVGRVKWFGGTGGKDNASWYRFDARHSAGPRFHNGASVVSRDANGVFA
ncbi:MAG: hypothetical protein E6R08_09785 [Nevskiaceae bacterium]|nr:MAG: hypothetical protein E6R08_09785 [Nevskiaceae bacterium]